jgi:hypothetical protein
MAAPTYSTDLTLINSGEATTNWTEPTGATQGGVAVAETDYFIQGTGCISKTFNATGLGGLHFNNGAGVTIPTDGAFFLWTYFGAPNALNTFANGGLRVTCGSGAADYKMFYMAGSDTYAYGGWLCWPVDPAQTADATQGSPSATRQFFGMVCNVSVSIGKGNPFGVDVIRYGRGTLQIVDGDLANGFGTFAGAAAENDTVSNRWGLLQDQIGSYKHQGHFLMGTSGTPVDFRDSNRIIFIASTTKVTANFNLYEVRNASSRVDWTGIAITALGTVSKGRFLMTDNADVNLDSCTFTDMDTFVFLSALEATGCTWRRCGQITAPGCEILNSLITSYTGASDTSALVWDANVDTNGKLDGTEFRKGSGTTHAIELGTTSPTAITLTNVTFSDYNASNGQNDSAIHVKRTTGTVDITITGGTTPSYKTDGATVNIIAGAVTTAVNVKDTAGSNIQNARVLLKAATGGPFPFDVTVTIANSGTTATVTHTGHGLSTNDKVLIKGASHLANNGVFTITVSDVNTYTYTMGSSPGSNPTGTIKSTFVFLYGLTDASGNVTMSRVVPSSQPVAGWVRKSSTQPYYREAALGGSVSNTSGYSANALMISDE